MATISICSIPECGKLHVSKGFCGKHYQRFKKYGDAQVTAVTPKGEAVMFFHQVVVPFIGTECLIWPYSRNADGYSNVYHDGKVVGGHRLICEMIHGSPPTPKHEASHACGRGHDGCVNPHHLSWKTRKENQADRIEHGTSNRGERSHRAKLTRDNVLSIRSLQGVISNPEITERFGVSSKTISKIHCRTIWAWLD